jgi:hypothetical protein
MWLGYFPWSQPGRRDRGPGFPRFPGARFPSVFSAARTCLAAGHRVSADSSKGDRYGSQMCPRTLQARAVLQRWARR